MAINYTEEQLAIIEDRGHNMLVSASAGSGKTTVMIERVLRLILDKDDPTPISKFLIVTFTKASAADMKKKLIESLSDQVDNEFALAQIDEVSISDISNLHSFCSMLISTYFYEVGIDPSFKVLDDTESGFLQERALNILFDKKEKDGDEDFFELYEIFQRKRKDTEFKKVIKNFNNFLNSNLNPDEWFNDKLKTLYDEDFANNSAAKIINLYVPLEMEKLSKEADELAEICYKHSYDKLGDNFVDIASALKVVKIGVPFEVNCKNMFNLPMPKTAQMKGEIAIRDEIENFRAKLKLCLGDFKKNYISSDIELLKNGLKFSKKCVINLYNLVREFNSIYSSLKMEQNSLDFNDLEHYALKILSNPEINEAVKSRYKYVFVDEYQDINSVQEKIISLVSSKNNRFMVGDVKQSIYRFRLCDPDIFLEKYKNYEKGGNLNKLFKLNCNFRSDKRILKFVDEVFSGVMTKNFGGLDYEKDSKFIAGKDNLDLPNSVNLCYIDTSKQKIEREKISGVYSVKNHTQIEIPELERADAEARFVADKIKELAIQKGADFKYGDVAILVGSRNDIISKFIENLKTFGIPVSSDDKYNLLERTYVQEVINYAKYVCSKNDDILLFKVLKSKLFNFTDNELVDLRMLDKSKKFYECIELYNELSDEKLRKKMENFFIISQKFRDMAGVLSLKKLCKKIMTYFSLETINLAGEFGQNANDEINNLISLLPDVDAYEFLVNYPEFSLEFENECGGDAISVMTIHKSKGIEFKYVFLVNTTNEFNFTSTFGEIMFNKDYGVGLDYFDLENRTQIETLASEGIKFLEKRILVEEQQRLLYVALTRAIEKLFIVCSKPEKNVLPEIRDHKICFCDWFDRFIYQELNGKHNELINFEKYELSELCDMPDVEKKQLLLVDENLDEPNWFKYEFLADTTVPLKSSVSKILKSLEDDFEDKFVAGNLNNSSAERGTVYHKIFESIDFKFGNFDVQLNKILDDILTEDERKLVDKNIILKVLDIPIFDEIKESEIIFKEREFYAKMPAKLFGDEQATSNFVMQGIIDLVAIKNKSIILLDYKTGKINENKLKNYVFQLNCYANIAERAFKMPVSKKIICLIDEQKILEI